MLNKEKLKLILLLVGIWFLRFAGKGKSPPVRCAPAVQSAGPEAPRTTEPKTLSSMPPWEAVRLCSTGANRRNSSRLGGDEWPMAPSSPALASLLSRSPWATAEKAFALARKFQGRFVTTVSVLTLELENCVLANLGLPSTGDRCQARMAL
jgi:hypothetical protein